MESIKLGLIEKLIAWLISPESYATIKTTVASMMDTEKTGEEKRLAVQAIVKPLIAGSASVLINLAIEVAVSTLVLELKKA